MRSSRNQGFQPVWNQLYQLHGDLNTLFDRFAGEGRRLFGVNEFPAFNVWEEPEAIHVEAELPGLDLSDLEVFVTGGNQLTVKGTRKPAATQKGVWHRQERTFGTFSRTLTLPYPVNADNVDAKFENGVLKLRLTKHESAKPRKIQVKSV